MNPEPAIPSNLDQTQTDFLRGFADGCRDGICKIWRNTVDNRTEYLEGYEQGNKLARLDVDSFVTKRGY